MNKLEYTTFIDPLCVPELTSVKENKDGVLIGASCSLNQIADRFSILVDKLPCTCHGMEVLCSLVWEGGTILFQYSLEICSVFFQLTKRRHSRQCWICCVCLKETKSKMLQ